MDKEIHTFPKGISLKGIIIAPLEFELASFKVTVQHVNYSVTGTTPQVSAVDTNLHL